MLKSVLWLAGACAAVLVALAVSRTLHFDAAPAPASKPVAVTVAAMPAAAAAKPVAEAVTKVSEPEAKPPPTPSETQVQEDAAATGMTTVEPDAAKAPATPPPT
ncbi:MAG TPA: hypothetical protein VFH92_08560 [Phenylobacterium sp.]|nr:hypothetical protein [Phenylobacterium sp.]